MEPYLWVCMRCGLYMKYTLPMAPGKHFCNSSNNAIEKNVKECWAILGTLLETEKSAATTPSINSTGSVPRPPPPPCPMRANATNQKEKDEIAAVSVKFAAVQEELALKIKCRAEKIEEASRKAEENQKAKVEIGTATVGFETKKRKAGVKACPKSKKCSRKN